MTKLHELNSIDSNQSWSNVEKCWIINLISNYQLVKVLTAIYKSWLIKVINKEEVINPDTIEWYDLYLLKHTFEYLRINWLFTFNSNWNYVITNYGKNLLLDESIAHLCFYSEAYDNVTSNISGLLKNDVKYWSDIERDWKSLGIHCDTLFKKYHMETILKPLNEMGVKKIVDIGCWGWAFLIDLAKNNKNISCIGLDISCPAIKYAQESAQSQNVNNQTLFATADAFDLSTWPEECFSADILCANWVIHEHFRDWDNAVINILNNFSKLIKEKWFKAIILWEPEIRYDLLKSDADLYLVHIFTAQGFPRSRERWLELFEKTELKCENVYTKPDAWPRFNFFVLSLR